MKLYSRRIQYLNFCDHKCKSLVKLYSAINKVIGVVTLLLVLTLNNEYGILILSRLGRVIVWVVLQW